LYLDLFRQYAPDDVAIPAVGKTEIINISELRSTTKLSYMIKAEPMSDDLESMFGKILSINHILQYSGGQLEREDIGKLIKLLPFANEEKAFDDFTLDYTRSENMMLALDRGDTPTPISSDKGPYMIKRLANRMAMADFQFLNPQIQTNYDNMIKIYEEMEAEKAEKMKAMEADFIPSQGAMIKVGWYVKDPTNSKRSIQATLPAQAIEWLVQRLQEQGGFKQPLEGLDSGAQAEIAQMYLDKQKQQPQQQQPQQPDAMDAPGLPTNRGFMQ
jgi:hypothetical protein